MESSREFRQYVRAVKGEFETSSGRHPTEDELIDYYRGRLEEREREDVQSHLVQCRICIETLKDINAFFPSSVDDAINQEAVDRNWATVWQQVEGSDPSAPRETDPQPIGVWRTRWAVFALAASLLAAFGTGLWGFRQWQERERLAGQLQTQGEEWAERLTALEQEKRRLQEEFNAAQQKHETELAELRQPALNAPIYDLFSRESIQRSGGGSPVNRLAAPPATRRFVVILHWDGEPQYPDYGVEIVNQTGQVVWRSAGLKPNSDGSFVMTLDRDFLGTGPSRLRLLGQRKDRARTVAEYLISTE